MEQINYPYLVEILGNVTEKNAKTILDMQKLLLKKFIFGDKEILAFNEIWFEKEEIKADIEYYQLIQSLITTFIKHFSDKTSFKEDLLAKEIISLFIQTKYYSIYRDLIELSNILEHGERYYIEISFGLYILGVKKGTPINAMLVDTLKDFVLEEFIEDSKFASQIKSINYDIINESFMKGLKHLYYLIKSNGDDKAIRQQIMILINHEDQSFVSTNIENTDNEDKKSNMEAKNLQTISPIKEQNLNTENIEKKDTNSQGNIPSTKEKELLGKIELDKDKVRTKKK